MKHHITYHSQHTVQQLYDIVCDVEKYPDYLPWVSACRITERGDDYFIAELAVAFKGWRNSYVSRVDLSPQPDSKSSAKIAVSLVQGPFKKLTNDWVFMPDDNGTKVDFDIEFEFKSTMLNKIMGSVFSKATSKMVDAFEKQINDIKSS